MEMWFLFLLNESDISNQPLSEGGGLILILIVVLLFGLLVGTMYSILFDSEKKD